MAHLQLLQLKRTLKTTKESAETNAQLALRANKDAMEAQIARDRTQRDIEVLLAYLQQAHPGEIPDLLQILEGTYAPEDPQAGGDIEDPTSGEP
jgi:hypothetical protein